MPLTFQTLASLFLLVVLSISVKTEDWKPIDGSGSISFHGNIFKPPPPSLSARFNVAPGRNKLKTSHLSSQASLFQPEVGEDDSCSLYKISLTQELFHQYVQYKVDMPHLKEFTLCMWSKFFNHSNDHTLFSYSVGDSPREIAAWISNTKEASYFTMAVAGHTFYRLNYPLKIDRWYHSCQSWNGKTGEWQIWVDGERVGRGFHNRLVEHDIPGNGVAISGQDQSLLYAEPKDDSEPIRQASLVGEITMLQLYSVALTAGKAHKDHKHHHVHHFKHDGSPLEATTLPPPIPETPATDLGNGAFLIGGQIRQNSQLNLGAQSQIIPIQYSSGLQLRQPYVNGQLANKVVSEQLLSAAGVRNTQSQPNTQYNAYIQQQLLNIGQISNPPISHIAPSPVSALGPSKPSSVVLTGLLFNPANVKYVEDIHGRGLFKRSEETSNSLKQSKRDKRDNPEKELALEESQEKKLHKRGLVALDDGTIIDDSLLTKANVQIPGTEIDEDEFKQSLLHGLAGFGGNIPVQNIQKDTVDEREPAEAEVKAVMDICSGCAQEPFKKAIILSWRNTSKKLVSGAAYVKGIPACKAF